MMALKQDGDQGDGGNFKGLVCKIWIYDFYIGESLRCCQEYVNKTLHLQYNESHSVFLPSTNALSGGLPEVLGFLQNYTVDL